MFSFLHNHNLQTQVSKSYTKNDVNHAKTEFI